MPSSLNRQLFLILLILNLIFAGIFMVWQNHHEKRAVMEQMKLEARGIYHYIVLTRQLISQWKGVYVSKDNQFQRKTPSGFTKALADLGQKKHAPFSIKLALDGNVDPDHAPDAFEQKAISLMKNKGVRELWDVTEADGRPVFRYAGPLVFDAGCTSCHAEKKKTGIIGCITVSLHDAERFFSTLKQKSLYAALYLTGAFGLLMIILWILLNRFVLKPLGKLDAAASRVQQGDLDVRLDLQGSAEWKCVGENFNSMVRELARQQAVLQEEVEKAVSSMKQAYYELKRTEQYKADFFTNITHDLKTPITAMKGALSLLKNTELCKDNPYLEILERNCTKLSGMVQDVLDCTRLDSGSMEFDFRPIDLAELIENTILMAMPLAWEKKIEINYQVPEHHCPAMIDPARMEQVMSNLLSNAIKFSPEHSLINVRLEPCTDIHGDNPSTPEDASFWLISVTDQGQGVPEAEREAIFDKFYQSKRYNGPEGLGLGLSIVKGIVELHRGEAGLKIVGDKGAVFYFTVPVLKEGDSLND